VVSEYSDVQKAVRVEKLRLWFAWVCGNVFMLMVAYGTKSIAVVSVVTQVLLAVVFVALTVALFRMTGALNRKAERARREVLGDDYPG
jgi:purine-cytosine permease-like protein